MPAGLRERDPAGLVARTRSSSPCPASARTCERSARARASRRHRRSASSTSGALSDPTFTRDGESVVYWKDEAGGRGGGALYRAPVDGSEPEAITPGGEAKDNDPAASPGRGHGRLPAARADEPGLWTAELPDGGSPERLTTLADDHDPAWSPDGSRMVFVRQGDLWIMNADGSGERQLTDDDVPTTAPAWSTR